MYIITKIHNRFFWWMNFDCTKNGGGKSFSCETKALTLFILMSGMCLRSPNLKRMDIIMKIHVYLFRKMKSKDNVLMMANLEKKGYNYKNTCPSLLADKH